MEADESTDPRIYPSQHALNETLEISHGFTDWLQGSFYVLSSIDTSFGWQWAGDRLRPQIRVPEAWHWPVGLSLSAELGYQRPRFSADTWTLELLPIVDKKIGRWYFAFNPTFDRSLHGPGTSKGIEFSPNFKASYDVLKHATAGLEYYSSYGSIGAFDPLQRQQHQIVPSLELDLAHKWEVNVGYGIGLTTGQTNRCSRSSSAAASAVEIATKTSFWLCALGARHYSLLTTHSSLYCFPAAAAAASSARNSNESFLSKFGSGAARFNLYISNFNVCPSTLMLQ